MTRLISRTQPGFQFSFSDPSGLNTSHVKHVTESCLIRLVGARDGHLQIKPQPARLRLKVCRWG